MAKVKFVVLPHKHQKLIWHAFEYTRENAVAREESPPVDEVFEKLRSKVQKIKEGAEKYDNGIKEFFEKLDKEGHNYDAIGHEGLFYSREIFEEFISATTKDEMIKALQNMPKTKVRDGLLDAYLESLIVFLLFFKKPTHDEVKEEIRKKFVELDRRYMDKLTMTCEKNQIRLYPADMEPHMAEEAAAAGMDTISDPMHKSKRKKEFDRKTIEERSKCFASATMEAIKWMKKEGKENPSILLTGGKAHLEDNEESGTTGVRTFLSDKGIKVEKEYL